MSDSLEILHSAKTAEEVELAINAVIDQARTNSIIDGNVRKEICMKLEEIASDPSFNAKLRRKSKRAVDSVSGTSCKSEYEGNETMDDDKFQSDLITFDKIQNEFDLQYLLNSLQIPDDQDAKRKLKCELLLATQKKTIKLNKNLQRRFSRLIYALSSEEEKKQIIASKPLPKPKTPALPNLRASTLASTRPISNKLGGKLSDFESNSANTSKSLGEAYSQLKAASSAIQIEEAISNVSASSIGDAGSRQMLVTYLTELQNNADLLSNSKLRRRVKRLIDMLSVSSPGQAAADTNCSGEKASTTTPALVSIEDNTNEVSVEDLISLVNLCIDSKKIADILPELYRIRPGIGSCKSRRLLRRAIMRLVSESGGLEAVAVVGSNRELVEQLTRVLALLEPVVGQNSELAGTNKAQALAADTSKKRKREVETDPKLNSDLRKKSSTSQPKPPAFVMFVGRMADETTAEDLQTFFRTRARVEGEIRVRLLTHKATGASRCMAFVEVESESALYECLSLHRSKLHNHVINIERSYGGGGGKKQQTLQPVVVTTDDGGESEGEDVGSMTGDEYLEVRERAD